MTVRDLDQRGLLTRVAAAIDSLPDADRQTLLLFVWEDLSYEDVAAALEVPVGTVRSRLDRARRRLRELCELSGKEGSEHEASRAGRATR